MKKIEFVLREILYQTIEKGKNRFTQADLSKKIGISISTVHHALKPLRKMNAVRIDQRSFTVIDAKKVLYYWASIRDLERDIIYQTRAEMPIQKIENLMPDTVVFGAYSAYKLKLKKVPSDYSEVYIYGSLEDIKKRFSESKKPANLIVLRKDDKMACYGKTTTLAQTFVDLWNIKTWYAKEFLKPIEEEINARILE